jgi:hypothetical protein
MGFNTYTTTDLVNNIKLVGHVPTGNSTFTQAQLITLADRELQTPLLKQILSTRGGYYLTFNDYVAVDTGLYVIPADCVMGALENVELISGTSIIQVNPIEESEQMSTISPTSTSYGYFMRGNYVQILPTPNNGSVRLWFAGRPSHIVATSSCAQVTDINGAVITVSSVPTNITTGNLIDAVGDQPPFNVYATQTILNITGTAITLDAPVTDLTVGDWICLNKQTCIPQIPVEFRPLLEQRVVCQIYESQGYIEKLNVAMKKLKELEEATFALITPRVKSKTKVIMPINGGFLAGTRRLTNFPAS